MRLPLMDPLTSSTLVSATLDCFLTSDVAWERVRQGTGEMERSVNDSGVVKGGRGEQKPWQ